MGESLRIQGTQRLVLCSAQRRVKQGAPFSGIRLFDQIFLKYQPWVLPAPAPVRKVDDGLSHFLPLLPGFDIPLQPPGRLKCVPAQPDVSRNRMFARSTLKTLG